MFLADEERALSLLAAADPRIAARGVTADPNELHHAAMSAIIAEDATLAMEGNRPDVLSFEVRSRAIDMAQAVVTRWKTRPDLEVELLARLMESERLRLASERELPRSASVLLGGLAATWRTPEQKEVGPLDEWLSRRLAEVTGSLMPQSLTILERNELEDALDPVERLIEGLPKSRAALVGLRVGVGRMEPVPRGSDRWSALSPRLRADAGTQLSADTLLALLSTEAKVLRDEIGQLVVKVTDDGAEAAGETLFSGGGASVTCHTQRKSSRVRALEPPLERAFDCSLRSRVIDAHTADENLTVLLAMHDAIIAASWAVVLARGGDATAIALATPKPLAPMSPTLEGKLMRFAATHPIEAIDRALSIEWIMRNGLAEAALRADAWRMFGDAPLDIVERELHPQLRAKSRLKVEQSETPATHGKH